MEPSKYTKGMLDITWHNLTYTMNLELAQSLAAWFKQHHNGIPSVQDWYNQLKPDQQAAIHIRQVKQP